MRTRLVMLTALLLTARATHAQTPAVQSQAPALTEASAQTPTQATAAPAGKMPFTGLFDVGGLFTGTDGDAARFERYRDTRDGLYTNINLHRADPSYLFDANASHIGYR